MVSSWFTAQPSQAAELLRPARHHRTYVIHHYVSHAIVLPPERHVIEVVRHAYSTDFIINGARWSGISACSYGWVAGEQVRLLEGEWHGACTTARFYNVPRHMSCEMTCPMSTPTTTRATRTTAAGPKTYKGSSKTR